MPKYNPKEARDAKNRDRARAPIKIRKSRPNIAPVVIIVGTVWIVVIFGGVLLQNYELNKSTLGTGGGSYNNDNDYPQEDQSSEESNPDEENIPEQTPYQTDLTLTTIDGDTIKLADHQGKIVIILYFGLNCYPCEVEGGILADIDDDYLTSQLLILLIASQPSYSTTDLNNWKNNYNSGWSVVREDVSHTYGTHFNIAYLPTTIVLDQNGNINNKLVGNDQGSYDNIRSIVDGLL